LSTVSNADYFISKKAFFFDLSPWADEVPNDDPKQKLGTDLAVMKSVFAAAHKANNGKMVHMGGFPPWPYKYVTPSSCSSRSADERTQSCQRFKPHTHTHTHTHRWAVSIILHVCFAMRCPCSFTLMSACISPIDFAGCCYRPIPVVFRMLAQYAVDTPTICYSPFIHRRSPLLNVHCVSSANILQVRDAVGEAPRGRDRVALCADRVVLQRLHGCRRNRA
jgi:hypothetical protein